MNDAVTCFSFSGRIDLGQSADVGSDGADPDACGAKGCYPDRPCAECRLKAGGACEPCGAPGEVLGGMFSEVVLCAGCKAAEEGGV